MTAINRVLLTGRLTRDPEVKYTQGGTAVVEMSIAQTSREKINDEWQDRVDYFDITVWAEQAEACGQYLSKGSLVAIDGKVKQHRWETKDDPPKTRSKLQITAQTVQFLDSRQRDEAAPTAAAPPAEPQSSDDDIPF